MKNFILFFILFTFTFNNLTMAGQGHVYTDSGRGTWMRDDGKEFPSGSGGDRVNTKEGRGGSAGERGGGVSGPAGGGSGGRSGGGEAGPSKDFYGPRGQEGIGRGNNQQGVAEKDNEYLQNAATKFIENTTSSLSQAETIAQESFNLNSQIFAEIDQLNTEPQKIEGSMEENFDNYIEAQIGKSFNELLGESTLQEKINNVTEKLRTTNTYTERASTAKKIGQEAAGLANQELAKNREDLARFNYHVAVAMLDIALDLTPGIGFGKAVYESVTGKSLLTGAPLTTGERVLSFIAAGTLGLAGAKGAIKSLEKLGVAALGEAREISKSADISYSIISKMKNIKISYGANLNKELRAAGREASYLDNGTVISGELGESITGYRAHRLENTNVTWNSFENPASLGKIAYAEKYAVDQSHLTHISQVKVGAGSKIELSVAGPNKWGRVGRIHNWL
jgi:hypothetical protein